MIKNFIWKEQIEKMEDIVNKIAEEMEKQKRIEKLLEKILAKKLEIELLEFELQSLEAPENG